MLFFSYFVNSGQRKPGIPMPKTETIIDYKGSISFETMEVLLARLRSAREFKAMKKPARKRLYSTFVESIDNMFKYAAGNTSDNTIAKGDPMITVKKIGDRFAVISGNLVMNDDVEDLRFKLDRVNQLDNEALKSLYEDIINQEADAEDKGAGLGLITMAMRTNENIRYEFDPAGPSHVYFTMHITIKE